MFVKVAAMKSKYDRIEITTMDQQWRGRLAIRKVKS